MTWCPLLCYPLSPSPLNIERFFKLGAKFCRKKIFFSSFKLLSASCTYSEADIKQTNDSFWRIKKKLKCPEQDVPFLCPPVNVQFSCQLKSFLRRLKDKFCLSAEKSLHSNLAQMNSSRGIMLSLTLFRGATCCWKKCSANRNNG